MQSVLLPVCMPHKKDLYQFEHILNTSDTSKVERMHNYIAEANAVQSILSYYQSTIIQSVTSFTVQYCTRYVFSEHLVIPVFVPACGEFGAEYTCTPPIVKLLVFF